MKRHFLFALAILACSAASVHAQIGGAVNQIDNTQTRQQLNQAAQAQIGDSNAVPQLYEGESSDLGPQSVVQPMLRHTLFEAKADVQFFYTDNALLTEDRKINSAVLLSTADFALAPTPYELWGGTLAPRVGYQGQWLDYFLNDQHINGAPFTLQDLDFSAQTVFGNATWTHGPWSVGAGLNAMRLFNTPGATSYDPIYDELVPNWMVQYGVPLCKKTTLNATYFGDYHFTSISPKFEEFGTSDANDRLDQGLVLSISHSLCSHAVFQPFYELKYTHFDHYPLGPREDFLNTIGGSLYLIVCPNFDVRAFVNYNIMDSSNKFRGSYREFDGGAGVTLSFRF